MPTTDIMVRKRFGGYQAFLADNEATWEAGRTEAEAVGKLIISARTLFGIAIVQEEFGTSFSRVAVKAGPKVSKRVLHANIRKLAAEKGKIDAIKYTREQLRIPLKEGLDYVDKVLARKR